MEPDDLLCSRNARPLKRGGEQPDYPSCSLRPHDQNVLPQCAQGRMVWLLPLGQSGKNPKIFARTNSTQSGVGG